jgi:hypothetical protein
MTPDRRITMEAVERAATETFKEGAEEEETTALVEAVMVTIHGQIHPPQTITHSPRLKGNHFLNLT